MAPKVIFALRRTTLILLLLTGTIGCDQVTKLVARDSLPVTGPLSYLNGLVQFHYAHNPGAFLSLGSGLNGSTRFWIFNVGVAVFLLLLGWFLINLKTLERVQVIGLTLVLGGGIGNMIDRFLFGGVTDFLFMQLGPLHTGVFNVADMAIVFGIVLLLVKSRQTKPQPR